MMTRKKLATKLGNVCYTSHIEPKNVDSSRNMDDRKNISGDSLFMGNNLISWLSKK